MKKIILKSRVPVAVFLIAVLCSQPVFAGGGRDDRGGRNDRGGHSSYSNHSSHGRHYYRDGRWYRHGWFWFDVAVTTLAIGALIDSLPPRHTTVVYSNVPYYYYGGYYYRPYPRGGYVVVQPPVVIDQPVISSPPPQVFVSGSVPVTYPQADGTFVVNVPNSRGGYTPVTIRKSGSGYVGPQGEYYSDFPSVEQLRAMYGR